MRLVPTDDALDDACDELLARDPDALAFPSRGYRRLLVAHLGDPGTGEQLDVEDRTLVALDASDRPVAFLPILIGRSSRHGAILNSLPFYGSNGGVAPVTAADDARRALIGATLDLARAERCLASTIVCSPFERDLEAYARAMPDALRDERIGQVTTLPDEATDDAFMAIYHQKTRNMVRKAAREGIVVSRDDSVDAMTFLAETHAANMAAIGGIAKPARFFTHVMNVLRADHDWRLYVAHRGAERVAALLVLRFGPVVEYFTPVVVAEARSAQPLSLVVHEAMLDARRAGARRWNWGGTWATQDGVYRFKKRWGTSDYPYHYFTAVHEPRLLRVPRDELGAHWPGFFAYPYAAVDALGAPAAEPVT